MVSEGLLHGDSAALQKHGQKLYRQGDFATALEAFTVALRKGDADCVGILDNRAATYTKLAQYDSALRDSRQIIKKDKHDERGYLRCAKVLILDGKPDKALDVYAYALKSLPSGNPQRQLVKQLHDKLRVKMFAKFQNPFRVLPLEIAGMVLQYLDFREIVIITRVSKEWAHFITSMRELWMCMDLSGASRKIHWSSILTYIRRSKGMLTHAVFKNVSTPSITKALEYISRCPTLEHLEVWDPYDAKDLYHLFKASKRLKTLVTSADVPISQEYISKFFNDLPLLERAEFHNARPAFPDNVKWPRELPNLKRLTLSTQTHSSHIDHIPALHVPALVEPTNYSVSNLEELRLDWDPNPPAGNQFFMKPEATPFLRRLVFQGMAMNTNNGFPASLEYLLISRSTLRGILLREYPFPLDMTMDFPNLRTLVLIDIRWVISNLVLAFVELAKAPLRVLHIEGCTNFFGDKLLKLKGKGNFNSLAELRVPSTRRVNDRVMTALVDGMEELKVLDLSHSNITGCTIKMLADFCSSDEAGKPKIERLYVNGCEDVSSDAVAYGRARGIEVFT